MDFLLQQMQQYEITAYVSDERFLNVYHMPAWLLPTEEERKASEHIASQLLYDILAQVEYLWYSLEDEKYYYR